MWRVIWFEFTPYTDSVTNGSLESYDSVGKRQTVVKYT